MIAALVGVGALTSGGGEAEGPARTLPVDVDDVARKLERVRGLRFDGVPPVRVVTAEEARDAGLAELDRSYPEARRQADTKVAELLGLLPPGSDLRELAGTIFGEEVAGFYDERKKEMALVAESFERDPRSGEVILAHELTHALEDQHFELKADPRFDDESAAFTALAEGTATVAMIDYGIRYLGGAAGGTRRQALQALRLGGLLSNENLPPYLQNSLVFPYVEGARFVDAIGTWGAANRALRSRPPISTEQVIHPEKYRAGERPLRVRLPRPGSRWRRRAAGQIGEFDTTELIRTSDALLRAQRAAAGWGGGRYALWQRGGAHLLVAAWRWDTPRDAAEFAAALPRYVERTLRGRRAGGRLWRTRDGRFVAVRAGETVRLAIAPTRVLARLMAR